MLTELLNPSRTGLTVTNNDRTCKLFAPGNESHFDLVELEDHRDPTTGLKDRDMRDYATSQ
jgi:hypothetical protein